MFWTEIGIQTVREDNHPLLVRAAYKRGSEYLVLGQRALDKIGKLGSLERCGIRYTRAGDVAVAETEAGDEVLVRGHDYASLMSAAVSVPSPLDVNDPDGNFTPETFSTPGIKTIAQVAEFTRQPVTSQMKSLVMLANGVLILVLLRGDHQLSDTKFAAFSKASNVRQATADELRASFGADAGSLGPVGVNGIRIVADEALCGRRNMISGANQNDFHLRNVTPGKNFACEYADLRWVNEGDTCVNGGPLSFHNARILDTNQAILETAAEQHHDVDGLALPASIAPFEVLIAPLHPAHLDAAKEIYGKLNGAGFDVLLDDRDVRPGVKFKDADLIGIPYRLNLGKKLAEGMVEVVTRSPKQTVDVKVDEISGWLRKELA